MPTTTTIAPPEPPRVAVAAAVWPTSLEPCGGDLPPCDVKWRESRGDYSAVSSGGLYRGAWQFSQSTWDANAGYGDRPDLIGIPPEQASPADQDHVARVTWNMGAGCGHWASCG